MARDRDPSPLFEIISRSRKPASRGIPVPDWMRQDPKAQARGATPAKQKPGSDLKSPDSREAQKEAAPADAPGPDAPRRKAGATAPEQAEPDPADPPERSAMVPSIGAPEEEQAYGGSGARLSAASVKAWLRRPIVLRLPRGTWMALGSAAVLLVVVGYMVGERVGEQRAEALATDYGQAAASLEAARSQPVRPDLIPPSVAGVERAPVSRSPSGSGHAEPSHGGESAAADPRRPGYNYFRLVSGGRGELERMSAFLAQNGVDSVLIPTNNGYKLMALPGFTRPRSDPEAVELHNRLRELGRIWRTQHRGSTDWGDMFPERYNPATN